MARDRPHALAVLAPAGRDRSGRARHVHRTFRQLDGDSDLDRGRAWRARDRPGGPGRPDGPAGPGLLRPDLRPVQGRGRAGPGRPRAWGSRTSAPAWPRPSPRRSSASPRPRSPAGAPGLGQGHDPDVVTVGPAWPGGGSDASTGDGHRGATPGRSWPRPAPTRRPRSSSPAGAPASPRGRSTPTRSSRPRSPSSATSTPSEPGEVDLCTFPLFALFAPILGMTCVVPEMDFTRPGQVNPPRIFEAIEDFGVTNLFGSPALIRRVGDYGAARGIKLPTLRRVISAGAPVPARVLETFASTARARGPGLHPLRRDRVAPGLLDRLRRDPRRDPPRDRPGGRRLRRPAGRGDAGRGDRDPTTSRSRPGPTTCSSPTARSARSSSGARSSPGPTSGRPEATALAKIDDPATGGFFHRMGDLGYRDDRGRIWFCGRKSHRVQTPGRDPVHDPLRGGLQRPPRRRPDRPGRRRRAGRGPGRSSASSRSGPLGRPDWEALREELLGLGRANPMTADDRDVPAPPLVPGRHPPQRQDLPREAGGLGGGRLG